MTAITIILLSTLFITPIVLINHSDNKTGE